MDRSIREALVAKYGEEYVRELKEQLRSLYHGKAQPKKRRSKKRGRGQ